MTTVNPTEKATEQRVRNHITREGFTLRKEHGRFYVLEPATGRCVSPLEGLTLEGLRRWLAE
jgi:hypothetical protein